MRHFLDRGQVEPLAALVAVLAVSAGFVVYTDTLEDTIPPEQSREIGETTLQRVLDRVESTGVVDPALADGLTAVPTGWRGNLTLRADGSRWSRGPTPPEGAHRATQRVSVRLAPAEIRPGQLRVAVWR